MRRAGGSPLMVGLVCLGMATVALGQREEQTERGGRPQVASAAQAIQEWPDASREVAQTMIDKYGQPDETTSTMLVWDDTGPFKRTIVYREPIDHQFPKPHEDVLEQFISYRTPLDKFDELARYDGSVIAERTKGELSARCDKEEMNLLALNLANDVATGKRSVEEARRFYAETVVAFTRGERPEYTQRLLFDPPSERAARDPDRALIRPGQARRMPGR